MHMYVQIFTILARGDYDHIRTYMCVYIWIIMEISGLSDSYIACF